MNDSMYGFIGTDVVLHCSFANQLPDVKITQVTWQKATNGSKQNVAIYNPAMGVSVLNPYRERVEFLRSSFIDGTIRLSRLELDDEGVYICEFATFPAGNRESQLNLTVMGKLAPPLPPCSCGGPGAWPSSPCASVTPSFALSCLRPEPQAWHIRSLPAQWGHSSLGVGGRAFAMVRARDRVSGWSPTWGLCGWPGSRPCGEGRSPWLEQAEALRRPPLDRSRSQP